MQYVNTTFVEAPVRYIPLSILKMFCDFPCFVCVRACVRACHLSKHVRYPTVGVLNNFDSLTQKTLIARLLQIRSAFDCTYLIQYMYMDHTVS